MRWTSMVLKLTDEVDPMMSKLMRWTSVMSQLMRWTSMVLKLTDEVDLHEVKADKVDFHDVTAD